MRQAFKFIGPVAVTAALLIFLDLGLRMLNFVPKAVVYPVYYSNLLGDFEPNMKVVDQVTKLHPYTFTTNSQGLRSLREITKEKEQKTIRILCLGDSYTMGWGVNDEDTYPELLYQKLKRKYPSAKFEVINAGFLFSNVLDHIDYFREKGRLLKPDIVIEQYCYNDIDTDMLRNAVGRQVFRLESARDFRFLDKLRQTALGKLAAMVKARMIAGGNPRQMIGELSLPPGFNSHDDLNALLVPGNAEIVKHVMGYAVLEENNDPVIARLWKNYLTGVNILKREVEGQGGKFLFMAIPHLNQTLDLKNGHSAVLYPYAEKNNVKFIDLARNFRKYPGKNYNDLFLVADGHTSPKGNELLTDAVAERIVVSDPSKPSVRITENPPALSYEGCKSIIMRSTPGDASLKIEPYDSNFFYPLQIKTSDMQTGPDMYYTSTSGAGTVDIQIQTKKPVQRCDLISFFRVFNDPAKLNKVTFSYSFDGMNYQQRYIASSDGSGRWDGMELSKIFEIDFPESGGNQLFLRFECTHDAGLAFGKVSVDEANRRIQANFYPTQGIALGGRQNDLDMF